MLVTLGVLLVGMTTLGLWVQESIINAVVGRTAAVTALYMDSFVSPLIQDVSGGRELSPEAQEALNRFLTETALGSEVVSVKIWAIDGRILYSPNPDLIGQSFPIDDELAGAIDGQVVSMLSSLDRAENEYERGNWDELIETYAPVRSEGTGDVIAVSEFYQLSDQLSDEVRRVQLRGWAIVGGATIVMFLVLVGLVQRAAATIDRQRERLEDNVSDLENALMENQHLHAGLRAAAVRTTTSSERTLRRVSADLHDGPAQGLAVALLLVEDVAAAAEGTEHSQDVGRVVLALDSALGELRMITHGLRIPALDGLSAEAVARRAIAGFETMTGERVVADCAAEASFPVEPVNIAIFRIVQESLMNSYKHAHPASRVVRVAEGADGIVVEIEDNGEGFDVDAARAEHSLGLAGMRERVEVLGGGFAVVSKEGKGTTVTVHLPLTIEGSDE